MKDTGNERSRGHSVFVIVCLFVCLFQKNRPVSDVKYHMDIWVYGHTAHAFTHD